MLITTDDLSGALQRAWQGPGAGDGDRWATGLRRYQPIAGSDEDQVVPAGVDNPLWEVVRWMPATTFFSDDGPLQPQVAALGFSRETTSALIAAGAERHGLCTRYAWSIISPGDVRWITEVLDGQAVIEIGAGTGYWAWQLEQAGVDVAAYDPHPPGPGNHFCTNGPYTTVRTGDASAVRHHQDRALLMVWPPYEGAHARHALAAYRGDLLVYAGQDFGGCTADDAFYELLHQEWEAVSVSPHHVSWWGSRCRLAAYRRRAGHQTTRQASTSPAPARNAPAAGSKAKEEPLCTAPMTSPAPDGFPAPQSKDAAP